MLAVGFAVTAGIVRLWPRALGRIPSGVTVLAAAACGAGLAAADAAPTGWAPLDAVLRAAFGVAVVLAVVRAGRWATCILAGTSVLVLAFAAAPAEALAYLAAGMLVALIAAGLDPLPLRAVVAAAVLQPLARADWPVATGATALAVVVATAPALVAAAAALRGRPRRVLVWSAAAVVLVCALGSLAGGTAALRARSPVNRGLDAALTGLDALGRDDREAAQAQLQVAADEFADARSALRAWWARPAFAVPVVAQQLRAVSAMAQSGSDLATVAVDAIDRGDPDRVRPRGGQVDLAALSDLEDTVASALASLERTEERLDAVDSPVLLPLVTDRLDVLADRVTDTRADAETAALAVDAGAELLGASEPRRYLLGLQTPAESRGVGGFMGSWAELTAVDGRLDLVRTGRLSDLTDGGPDPAARLIEGQDDYVDRYGQLGARYWGTIGFSPDFPTVGSIMAQLFPESGGSAVDGVILMDPYAFASFLELTGPITVPGYPEPLTPANAARILLHDQYLVFGDEERVEFLEDATTALFDAITEGDLPGPAAIAAELGPAIEGRHLQLYATRPEEQAFFERIGANGAVPPAPGDSIGFVGQNFNGNKIDYFLHRSATYDVQWDPATGGIDGDLELVLRNDAPAAGLPHAVIGWGGDVSANQRPVADGENLMLLSLYSAVPITGVTLDDAPLGGVVQRELGRYVYTALVSVPPGASRTVRMKVDGTLPPGTTYTLDPVWQPMVNADELAVTVSLPDGWVADAGGDLAAVDQQVAGATWALDGTRRGEVEARPAQRTWLDRLRGE